MHLRHILFAPFAAFVLLSACDPQSPPQDNTEYKWLPASNAEKFLAIEDQLQGYSRTMREVHYRYNELYFAGQDNNWPYADYQLEHIVEAIEQGMARRPARATHSLNFIKHEVPSMQEAIDKKDPALFAERYEDFTHACNACHAMEEHPFIRIGQPTVRFSAVQVGAE